MPLSLYQASVPVYVKLIHGLEAMIDKAVAHATANKFPAEQLLGARLAPGMWNFSEQVKAVTNHAFRGTARLAGLPIPTEIPDTCATVEEMKARIAATLAWIQAVDPAIIDAGADREITFPLGGGQKTMTGKEYFLGFTLPNFYFHLTTAYNILRHNGVPLTKTDFTGPI